MFLTYQANPNGKRGCIMFVFPSSGGKEDIGHAFSFQMNSKETWKRLIFFHSQRHLGLEMRKCNSCVSLCFPKNGRFLIRSNFFGSTGLRSLVFCSFFGVSATWSWMGW